MPLEIADRLDLHRLADDGCPHVSGETKTYDVSELWNSPDEDMEELLPSVSVERVRSGY